MPELEFIRGRRETTAEYTFGLPYTSTGSFAAVWNTNAEARLRGTSLYFEGVAIDAADGRPVGIFTERNAAGDEVQSVEAYIERCKRSYGDIFASCELVSEDDIKMSSLDAKKCVFAVTSGGVEYKMLQAIVKKGDAIYCMTYTATAENYDAHVADVEKMIEVFEIR